MFQTVIAVLIGMSFLYFILAVLCSGIKEFIAAKIDLRASTLETAIAGMLSNNPPEGTGAETPGQQKPVTTAAVGDLATLFYKHPLILGLGSGERKPSYIPAQYFSSVLEQVLKAGKSGTQDYTTLITNLPDGTLKQKLSALADRVGNDAAAIRTEVEHWFDTTMDRVSGWYKRQAQKIVLAVAFVLVIGLNADSFAVFRALWQNSTLRDTVVATAQNAKVDMTSDQAKQELSDLKDLPLGWKTGPSWDKIKEAFTTSLFWFWVLKFIGWSITAFATTLGAPFWFDAMNKLINIRLSGTPPQRTGPPQPVPTSTVVIQTEGRAAAAKA